MFMSKGSALFLAVVCLVSLSVSKANEEEDSVNAGGQCPWTGPTCIENCHGRPNGWYQSCHGCYFAAYCYAGNIYYANCSAGDVWDDDLKQCRPTSKTCYCYAEPENCTATGWRCISSCQGLPNGDYQSCHGCSVYASCVAGKIIDYRPCAPATSPLQWDDYLKKCEYTSSTCYCYRKTQKVQDQLPWSEILKK